MTGFIIRSRGTRRKRIPRRFSRLIMQRTRRENLDASHRCVSFSIFLFLDSFFYVVFPHSAHESIIQSFHVVYFSRSYRGPRTLTIAIGSIPSRGERRRHLEITRVQIKHSTFGQRRNADTLKRQKEKCTCLCIAQNMKLNIAFAKKTTYHHICTFRR